MGLLNINNGVSQEKGITYVPLKELEEEEYYHRKWAKSQASVSLT